MKKKIAVYLAFAAVAIFALGGCAGQKEAVEQTPADKPVVEQPKPQPKPAQPKPAQPKPAQPKPEDKIETSEVTPGTNAAMTETAGLEMIHFDFDKSAITPAAQKILDANYELMTADPAMNVLITGHCDERGTDTYNELLGMRRAEATKEYLVKRGIAADRISTSSDGERNPIDPAQTQEAYAMNRRAEFAVK